MSELAEDGAKPALTTTSSPPISPAAEAPASSAGEAEIIDRWARDPAITVEKLQGLYDILVRSENRRASIAFAEAFPQFLADLPVIDRKGRLVIYSKADRDRPGGPRPEDRPIQVTAFAELPDILAAIHPIGARHGFSVRFEHNVEQIGESYRIKAKAFVRHRLGHEISAESPPLMHDSSGSKNPVQAVASTMTYGKRYALLDVVPIVSHAPQDKDNDGASAGEGLEPATAEQIEDVKRHLERTKTAVAALLKKAKAESLEGLSVEQYKRSIAFLAEKERRQKETQ